MSVRGADPVRAPVAELVGTALLLVAVVGSGIMGDTLSGGNMAIALLANSLATGTALIVLILTFGPVSGAHFNPAVTVADAVEGGISWPIAGQYVLAQVVGAFIGVAIADWMFARPVFSASGHARSGLPLVGSEFVATFGLMAVIWGCSRRRGEMVPFAVGAYITAAYWFTSSTSFANPAVTLARAATNTFAGIRPVDVPPFVVAQSLGAAAATLLFRWLVPTLPSIVPQVTVPHGKSFTE
jgi:glycerol uptake facilitator-like aquaporin